MVSLLDEIQKCLIGVPQYDGGVLIDEDDDGYFQIEDHKTGEIRDVTEDEIKILYPVIWARRQLITIIQNSKSTKQS